MINDKHDRPFSVSLSREHQGCIKANLNSHAGALKREGSIMKEVKNLLFLNSTEIKLNQGGADDNQDQDYNDDREIGTVTIEKNKVQLPKKYKVLLFNDDYTTMEFVVMILQKIFHRSFQEAQEIMLNIHHTGVGICGVYTFEVAETKLQQVKRYAKEHGYPLKCSMEPE